jgi:uncharacterized protein YprB with RNaseH-like and TPR domain
MSVKERLKRLSGESNQPPSDTSRKEIISQLRKKIDAVMERRDRFEPRPSVTYREPPIALQDLITGEEVENSYGRFYFCRSLYPGSACHGRHLICSLRSTDMEAAVYLSGNSRFACLDMSDALFLDTETTGLAGGTGTFAFLVGLGWFEGEDFIVCQLFARDFSEEQAMLCFLQEIAGSKGFLVTFNGRAYDINLLASRYILNRLSDPFPDMPHLDLLHPSRRLVGHRLENSRLVTLESCVLEFERHGDVPGYEIPQRYFDWLRIRDARLMEDVFEHNRLDIISMAALVKHLADLLTGVELHAAHPADLIAAARMHCERGNTEAAQRFFQGAAAAEDVLIARDARKLLSLMHKRAGCWEEAVKIWEEMVFADPDEVFAAEELAKYLEHRIHDFARAIEIVERVFNDARCLSGEDNSALLYRLERLRNKHERKTSLTKRS